MSRDLNHDTIDTSLSLKRINKSFLNLRNALGSGIADDVLDLKIDKALHNLQQSSVRRDTYNYAENVRNLLTKSINTSNINMQTGINLLTTPENSSRILRYLNADEITNHITYAARALKVLTDGIITPDNVTKECVNITTNVPSKMEEHEETINKLYNITDKLKIEKRIFEIVHETLKYGDYFIEIADVQSKEVPITQAIQLTESMDHNSDKRLRFKESFKIDIKPDIKTLKERLLNEDYYDTGVLNDFKTDNKFKLKLEFTTDLTEDEYSSLNGRNTLLENIRESDEEEDRQVNIKDVRLITHDQRRVVKIQSKKHKTNLGYMILPETADVANFWNTNTTQMGPAFSPITPSSMELQTNTGVDAIYNELITIIKHHTNSKDASVNKKEFKDLLSRIVTDMEKESQTVLSIRYVPPERMEHFQLSSRALFPYGESIFTKVMFAAKQLIVMKTAVSVKRMTDSADRRVMYVDTTLPRNSRNMIEGVKEALQKYKHSINGFTTISSIPSMLTTFQDLIIPQNKGKRYIEFDTLPSHVNLRDMSEELKFMRDELISGLEVPAPFLSIDDQLSNKCLPLDTKIKSCGEKDYFILEDLIKEYEETGEIKDKFTYSYDKETGKVVPGKISWAGKTRLNAELVEVEIDNGEKILATPDHKFMLRNGEYKEAQYLEVNESLMPLYLKNTHKSNAKNIPYINIYHPGINKWDSVHRSFGLSLGMCKGKHDKIHIHHIDENPQNNSPINLVGLTESEHHSLHCKKLGPQVKIEKICKICNKKFKVIKHRKHRVTCSDECKKTLKSYNSSQMMKKRYAGMTQELTCKFCGKKFIRSHTYINAIKTNITCGSKECYSKGRIEYFNTEAGKQNCVKAGKMGGPLAAPKLVAYNKLHGAPMKGKKRLNHKVISVRFVNFKLDCGDITVDIYHNFALKSGIFVKNSALAHESGQFAETIMSYQKIFGESMFSLYSKLYKYIYKDLLSEDISVSFSPPRMLMIEKEAEHAATVANMIETLFNSMGISKEYSKKKWYDNIDWKEVEEEEIKEKLERRSMPMDNNNDPMGGQPTGDVGMVDPSMLGGGMSPMGPPMGPPPQMMPQMESHIIKNNKQMSKAFELREAALNYAANVIDMFANNIKKYR